MKSKYSSSLLSIIFTATLATTGLATAGDLFWNSTTDGDWNTSTGVLWAPASGTTPSTAWLNGEAAIFDQAATYTVTVTEEQSAESVLFSAGDVTLAGANKISSPAVTINAGAKLTAGADNYLQLGTTALLVNGTLDHTVNGGTNTRATLAGSGTLTLTDTIRLIGPTNFSGNIEGPLGINTENAGDKSLTFSGTNSYAGDFLVRNGQNIRLASADALSPNSFLRLGSGILELAAGDISKFVTGGGAGNIRISVGADSSGNAGFAAIDTDRTVELKNPGEGSVIWGTTHFFPAPTTGSLVLGSAASTHKVNLISGIDLGEATRSLVSDNGAAAVEGEISGVLSGETTLSGIKKFGAGVLVLSADNTFLGPVEMNAVSGVNTGWLRVAHNNALGPDTSGKLISLTSSTAGAKGGIQLIGGVTVNTKSMDIGGRSSLGVDSAVIQNVSGNNAWNGFIRIAGPGGSYHLASLAGTLTLGGNLFNNINNSTRPFIMLGEGNFLLTGSLKDNSAIKISGLTQTGTGTTTLSGTAHTYSGATQINAGTVALAAGASLANSSPINVTGGTFDVSAVGGWTLGTTQTLSGTGSVVGAITVDGTITPATAAVGDLSFSSDLTLSAASTYEVSIAEDGLSNDKLLVSGNLMANGDISVSLNGYVPVVDDVFDIADAASISGTPTVNGDALPSGLGWDTSDFTTTGTIKVAVAEADPYGAWAASKGLTESNNGVNQDPDFDSVSNLIEFVLGGEPNPANPGSNSTGLLPAVSTAGGNLVFSFTRDPQSEVPGLALKIEVGTDLLTFPDVYTVGSSPEITVDGNLVSLSIPQAPDARKFARLNAVYTAP